MIQITDNLMTLIEKTLQELSTLSEDVYPELHNPVYIELEQDTIVVVT